jgi:hypothetical protein
VRVSNVPPWDPKLPPCRDAFSSRLFTSPVHAGIDTLTISYFSPTLYRPETPCATIPCSQYTVLLSQSVAAVHRRLDRRLAQRQLRVPVRSKQGALGLLRRSDYPGPACMPSVAVGGRCVAVVSARRAVSRESFRLRWLKLLAKSRPISLTVTSMIGSRYPRAAAGTCRRALWHAASSQPLRHEKFVLASHHMARQIVTQSFYGFLWPRGSCRTGSHLALLQA